MKHISQLLFFSILLLAINSCKKAENKVFFEGATPPSLTASRVGTIPLSFAAKDQEAIKLSWTNPDYKFTTGISSQGVSYLIEIDTTGANFTNPKRQSIAISNDLTISFTVSAFNDFLLNQLQLDSLTTHNLEIRLTSSIGGTVKMYSNVLKFTGVKPYAIPPKVQPPGTPPQYLNGKLFIVGSATPGGDAHGWDNPVPVPSQQFTRISATLYEITIALIGGKEYLFLPENGSWSNKYACNSTSAQSPDGGDFGYNGSNNNWNANFPGPAVGGTYKISVDFQRGKYTVTKQ